jgi:hypothetical protein
MKTHSAAMAKDSQHLAQLQGQVTSLQAEMATRAEIQSTREAVDRLAQMVQLRMDDNPRNPEKQPIPNTETHTETHSPNRHILQHSEPPPPNPPPVSLAGESHSFSESSHSGRASNPRLLGWNSRVSTGKIPKLGVAELSNSLKCIARRTLNVSPFPPPTWMEKP